MATGGSIFTNALSDEIFDFMCIICKRNGKNCEAEKYCEECNDYFCLTCVKVHDDLPSLTGHTILSKEQFPKKPTTSFLGRKSRSDAPTERCDKHSHHFIDMYCQSHDEVGCGTCMAVSHRLCSSTFYIPEYVTKNRRISRSCEMEQKLNAIAISLNEHLEIFKKEKELLLKSKEETLQAIKKFRKEINDRLDELEKTTVDDIAVRFASLIDVLDKGIAMFESNKVKVNNSIDLISKSNESITQKFVSIKKSKDLVSKTIKSIEENKLRTPSQDIKFSADIKILPLLKEMNALGKTRQQSSMRQEHFKPPDIQAEESLHKTKAIKKYKVGVKGDRFECSILTACAMADGTIVLSEGRNNKLKRLNGSTFAIRDFCDVPGKPWQVCAIKSDQVAVTLPRKEKVLFVSLSNKMSVTQDVATGFNCYGLAHAAGILYISDRFTTIYAYNLAGGKLQKFTKDPPSKDMSYAICSLAVLEDGSKLFVAGWNNGLIALDNRGKVVGKYKGPELDGAWDCHLTGEGSLLVSGNNSNNVLQFGLDCKLKGEVVKFGDNKGSYKGLCCNKKLTKMIVGKTGDEIEVYDII